MLVSHLVSGNPALQMTGALWIDAAVWLFFVAYILGLILIIGYCVTDIGVRRAGKR